MLSQVLAVSAQRNEQTHFFIFLLFKTLLNTGLSITLMPPIMKVVSWFINNQCFQIFENQIITSTFKACNNIIVSNYKLNRQSDLNSTSSCTRCFRVLMHNKTSQIAGNDFWRTSRFNIRSSAFLRLHLIDLHQTAPLTVRFAGTARDMNNFSTFKWLIKKDTTQ